MPAFVSSSTSGLACLFALLLQTSASTVLAAPAAQAADPIDVQAIADAVPRVPGIPQSGRPGLSAKHSSWLSSPRMSCPEAEKEIGAANAAARIEPVAGGFEQAIQRYAYREGALFQIYARTGQVTDIALQEGERLAAPGPVAAGDTARWIIGDAMSGKGSAARVHILIKPLRDDISTNLVINTDRRTYHLELRASAKTYMASVSWRYPEDELIALRIARTQEANTIALAGNMAPQDLNFDYRISGDRTDWRPVRVFDDGRQTMVEFPPDIARKEMPPLFLINKEGKTELVNYRVTGRYMIVDRLFHKAEMRLGAGRRQSRVEITNLMRRRR